MFYQWIVKKKKPPTFNQFIKGISNTKSNKMVPVQNIYIIANMIYIKLGIGVQYIVIYTEQILQAHPTVHVKNKKMLTNISLFVKNNRFDVQFRSNELYYNHY